MLWTLASNFWITKIISLEDMYHIKLYYTGTNLQSCLLGMFVCYISFDGKKVLLSQAIFVINNKITYNKILKRQCL